MINIDISNLRLKAMNVAGCYMVGVSTGIEKVLIDGAKKDHVFYCDVNSGFAVIHKTTITGQLVVADNELVYELFFGKVEVVHE